MAGFFSYFSCRGLRCPQPTPYSWALLFGTLNGTLDVSMNAYAVAVEEAWGRHIMNGCHAAWSIGAVAGALVGSGAAETGISRTGNYAAAAAVLVPLVLVSGRFLLPTRIDRDTGTLPGDGAPRAWRAWWTRQLLVFGAMGASVLTLTALVPLLIFVAVAARTAEPAPPAPSTGDQRTSSPSGVDGVGWDQDRVGSRVSWW